MHAMLSLICTPCPVNINPAKVPPFMDTRRPFMDTRRLFMLATLPYKEACLLYTSDAADDMQR
eukprot:3326672-Rhodomonas_salina.1